MLLNLEVNIISKSMTAFLHKSGSCSEESSAVESWDQMTLDLNLSRRSLQSTGCSWDLLSRLSAQQSAQGLGLNINFNILLKGREKKELSIDNKLRTYQHVMK